MALSSIYHRIDCTSCRPILCEEYDLLAHDQLKNKTMSSLSYSDDLQ